MGGLLGVLEDRLRNAIVSATTKFSGKMDAFDQPQVAVPPLMGGSGNSKFNADLVDLFFTKGIRISTECHGAMALAYAKGLLDVVKKERFDSLFKAEDFQLWVGDVQSKEVIPDFGALVKAGPEVGRPSDARKGDWGYFQGYDTHTASQGQNVIADGSGKFWAFPYKLLDPKEILDKLESHKNEVPGAAPGTGWQSKSVGFFDIPALGTRLVDGNR